MVGWLGGGVVGWWSGGSRVVKVMVRGHPV